MGSQMQQFDHQLTKSTDAIQALAVVVAVRASTWGIFGMMVLWPDILGLPFERTQPFIVIFSCSKEVVISCLLFKTS